MKYVNWKYTTLAVALLLAVIFNSKPGAEAQSNNSGNSTGQNVGGETRSFPPSLSSSSNNSIDSVPPAGTNGGTPGSSNPPINWQNESKPESRQEGFIDKVKEIFKGNEKKEERSGEPRQEPLASGSGQPNNSTLASGGGELRNGNNGGSSSQGNSTEAESRSGIIGKVAEKGKDILKGIVGLKDEKKEKEEKKEGPMEKVGSILDKAGGKVKDLMGMRSGDKEDDKKRDGLSRSGESQEKKEGPLDRMANAVAKGKEKMQDAVNKIEDRAIDMRERVSKVVDENVYKPMKNVSGSGVQTSQGQMTPEAQANTSLKGADREKYLLEQKKKQEAEIPRPGSLKDIVIEAKSRGVIPKNEDRSALKGNHDDEKSVAVEMYDKVHEMAKLPVENILKPIDKMLGYEKDPLLRMYDNSHEIIRKPIGILAKPIESVLTGAFKTTDEAKKDTEKLLAQSSEQERKEAKLTEMKRKKEDRSAVGEIFDRTVDLATKPMEIALKPIDHLLGFEKNPFLKLLDNLYGLSKMPVDMVSKPFENILRNMAERELWGSQPQVSIRFAPDTDPKLFTRLADGTLNVADRVLTKPLEIVMKPLDHMLGYDEPGKRNPIVAAAHSLKNATKVGVELLTKPFDRVLHEWANYGDGHKSHAQMEEEWKYQKEEASRLVMAVDKIHRMLEVPVEIVLKPMGKVLGYSEEGKKEPFIQGWDSFWRIVRTPLQIFSRPVEDALIGPPMRKHSHRGGQQGQGNNKVEAKASASSANGGAAASASAGQGGQKLITSNGEPDRKNYIVEKIKKLEKMAIKPFEVITSPVRRLILGEDNNKVGTPTEKNNREMQSKAKSSASAGGSGQDAAAAGAGQGGGASTMGNQNPMGQRDKIMLTLEQLNNVMLKPIELSTLPISDFLFNGKKRFEKERMSQGESGSGSGSSSASAAAATNGVGSGNQQQSQSGSRGALQMFGQQQQQSQPPQQQSPSSSAAATSNQAKKN